VSQDAFQGSEPVQFYIRTLAQLRDIDEAIEQLDHLLSIPAAITIPFVRADPFMDPIVDDPRFAGLAERYPSSYR
jgi:hypothetical protein